MDVGILFVHWMVGPTVMIVKSSNSDAGQAKVLYDLGWTDY